MAVETVTVPMIYEFDAGLLEAVAAAIDAEILKQCTSGMDADMDFIAAAAILAVFNHQRRQ